MSSFVDVQWSLLELSCVDGLGIHALGEVKRDKFTVTKGGDSLTLLGDADAI